MNKRPASSTDNPPRPGSSERGMVVYVDAQLRSSKRFDAAGLAKDHPQLFEPVGRRRSSSTTSVNTLSAYPSSVSLSEAGKRKDEGQLRYWTSEMCSNSPQLFDFVITVSTHLILALIPAWRRWDSPFHLLAIVSTSANQHSS